MNLDELATGFTKTAAQNTFDKVIVGGGLAGTFTAYQLLHHAARAGQPLRVLLMTPEFSSPCAAGNQLDTWMEGLVEPNAPTDPRFPALLRQSDAELKATIERENISCRLRTGYEMKSKDKGQLDHAISLLMRAGIADKEDFVMQNPGDQILTIPEHGHSATVHGMAQINVGELLAGLRSSITRMGGVIMPGCLYTGQGRNQQGGFTIHTTKGDFISLQRPLLATGSEHMYNTVPGLKQATYLRHTMGVVLGPLSPEDASQVAKTPMAFTDAQIDGDNDIFWGSRDANDFLTIGWGELEEKTPESREELKGRIFAKIEEFYPGFLQRYESTIHISFGTLMRPPNKLPIVGRMSDYDIAGGWGAYGILPGFGAAQAFARAYIKGDDATLRFFESMQPDIFTGKPLVTPALESSIVLAHNPAAVRQPASLPSRESVVSSLNL